MKPTTDGRWAHLACAIWIPGSVFTFVVLYKFLTEEIRGIIPYL